MLMRRKLTVKPPPPFVQMDLLSVCPDKQIHREGERRTRYGQVVEEVLTTVLPLDNIVNSGSYDAVYDAYWNGWNCEIKSINVNGELIVYDWREKKDIAVVKQGEKLVYLLANHKCHKADSMRSIYEGMAATLTDVYVLSQPEVSRLLSGRPRRGIKTEIKGNKRHGYNREGYRDGYRTVPMKQIREMDFLRPTVFRGELYNLPFEIRLHRCSDLRGKFRIKP